MKYSFALRILSLSLLAVTILATGCKKKTDADTTSDSFFVYDGTTYPLSSGFVINFGEYEEGSYNFDILLLSPGVVLNFNTETGSGTGHYVYFELFTLTESGLAPGTYTFDDVNFGAPNTFEYADFGININFATVFEGEDPDYTPITGGSITISRSGNQYEIEMNCTTEGGKTMTGTYKGTLQAIDERGMDKTPDATDAAPRAKRFGSR